MSLLTQHKFNVNIKGAVINLLAPLPQGPQELRTAVYSLLDKGQLLRAPITYRAEQGRDVEFSTMP